MALPSPPADVLTPDSLQEGAAPRPRRWSLNSAAPFLLLAPSLVFLAIFFAWPMVQALILAVQTEDGQFTTQYLQRMVGDVNFSDAIRNTLLLILTVVPLQFVLAVIMGLLLQAKPRGASFFLYLWTIPLGISDLAAGIVWLAIFGDRGFLNSVLTGLGLMNTPFAWLSYEHPLTLLMAVVVAEVWRATSIVMVIVVAGLQHIPPDYNEAAEVFGATTWQRLWHVTLPMLRPSLQVALILRTILAFQVFAVVVALAGTRMPVLASEAYNWYSGSRNPNVAAAYALLILVFSLLTTGLYLRALRTRDEELGQ